MTKLSIRHKIATIENASNGIGVSASVRKYLRENVAGFAGQSNTEINEAVAVDFVSLSPHHRFKLNKSFSGIGEIRVSGSGYFYIARLRERDSNEYDILVIQQSIRPVSEKSMKARLTPGWGFDL